jgi:hypothetical protein
MFNEKNRYITYSLPIWTYSFCSPLENTILINTKNRISRKPHLLRSTK